MCDGVLYYNWIEAPGEVVSRLVLPEVLRSEVLKMAHDGPLGGHWGRDKTSSRMRKLVFWPGMEKDVALFIKTCSTCNCNKNHPKNRAPLTSYQAGLPNERVHLDFLGPFSTSRSGNKYILSIVDQFTKWIEVYALPEQTAAVTARTFFDGWISRFGVPQLVHTDQGRNFTSQLFSDLCRMLEATKTRTTPYRPSANGQVERYNQMILSYIRCQLQDDETRWDEHLAAFGMSLRATVNRNTGFTPNLMQLGREISMPLDILLDATPRTPWTSTSVFVRERDSELRQAFRRARLQLGAAQGRQKTHYDTRACIRTKAYEAGDLIYLVNKQCPIGKSTKLQPTMVGPYVVCNSLAQHLYSVRDRRKTKVVHQDQMRLCEDRCVPLWVPEVRQEVLDGEQPHEDEPVDEGLWQLFEPLWAGGQDIPEERPPVIVEEAYVEVSPEQVEEEEPETVSTTRRGRLVRLPARFRE